jgi:hypothetical protein
MVEPRKLSKRTAQLLDDLLVASDVAAVSAEYDGEYQQELHMRDFSRRKARLISRLAKLEQQAAAYRQLTTRQAAMSGNTLNKQQIIETLQYLGYHTHDVHGAERDVTFKVCEALVGRVIESNFLPQQLAAEWKKHSTDDWVFNAQTGEFEIPETEVPSGQEGEASRRTTGGTQETRTSEGRT